MPEGNRAGLSSIGPHARSDDTEAMPIKTNQVCVEAS
jgi:hypothetical protein